MCSHPRTEVVEVTGFQRYFDRKCLECDKLLGRLVSEAEKQAYAEQQKVNIQKAIEKQVEIAVKKKNEGGSI